MRRAWNCSPWTGWLTHCPVTTRSSPCAAPGDGTHHGHSLAVACDQAQHGIAVVLVLKDYMLNRTADHGVSAHFPHSLLTVVQIFADVLRTADCDPPVLFGNQPG